ncbi:MAG: DNA replication/repair protein RecF [Ilumatobacteraceae bacterium]
MIVRSLQLTDFRNYSTLHLALGSGVHALTGDNAQGKTNLVEALVVLSTMKSFRGVANDAVVRKDAASAFLRADIVHDDLREFLVEIELKSAGRSVAQVNRKRVTRTRDLLSVLRTTVFTPDDRNLVHGAASLRRSLLDDAVVSLDPARQDTINELERVLRQRNALLKESGYRPSSSTFDALDAWDEKLAAVGDEVGRARAELIQELLPLAQSSYRALVGDECSLLLAYDAPWREAGLACALRDSRDDDLRRGSSTIGPHRDDMVVSLDDFASRTQGSHGEQHSLGLALRMAVHHLVSQRWGTPPLVVLDDVLSALDNKRASALFERLLSALPYRQVLVTSAHPLPASPRITHWLEVVAGTISSCTQDER